MKVSLEILTGQDTGKRIGFDEPRTFIIGRADDADLRLPDTDRFVSRRHVHLEICPPNCRLKDIGTDGTGSPNKPLLNGHPVDAADLKDGDVLQLGYTRLRLGVTRDLPALLMRQCPGCGHSLQLFENEAVPDRCPPCVEQARKAQRAESLPAQCAECGADLSAKANSDGRVRELADVAHYACEGCLPKIDPGVSETVQGYRLLRRLGEGGMGTVYLAYHAGTARLWALKRIKDLQADLSVKQRFSREVLLHAKQVHRNIVRSIETGVDGKGTPFVVTEFVEGCDLEAVSGGLARLKPATAVVVVSAVLEGLEYVHSQQIVHRDLKPSNILLQGAVNDRKPAPSRPVVPKIADFGLAVCYGVAGGPRLTKLNTTMGTLMYMPPEQVRNAREVKETADLYAMGMVLYYLLTGRYSFDFPTPADLDEVRRQRPEELQNVNDALRFLMKRDRVLHPFQIILRDEPTPLRKRDPSIGERLASVVDRAVQKDPAARFQTAAEFRAALRGALS